MGVLGFTRSKAGPQALRLHTYKRWRKKYVRSVPDSPAMLYVNYNEDGKAAPLEACTCSEATGWGMMAAGLADERKDFAGFLALYERHVNASGLMSWQILLHGDRLFVDAGGPGYCSATDGDLDAAYALLLAGKRWGMATFSQRGIQACRAIHRWCIHPTTNIPLLGDWAARAGAECGPHPAMHVTRPSDFILDHFSLFAEKDGERREAWLAVEQACIAILIGNLERHPTGLVPDFLVLQPATGQYLAPVGRVLESERDGHFAWNACRVPWRLAVSHLLSPVPALAPILHSMSHFFAAQPVVSAGYNLKGEPLENHTSLAFLVPAFALLKALKTPHAHLAAQITAEDRDGTGSYYSDTIALLVSLQLQQSKDKRQVQD